MFTLCMSDKRLEAGISRVRGDNYGVYRARKVWLQLNREGAPVARCTVERLVQELGLAGVRRGKLVRTTIASAAAARPTGSGGSSARQPRIGPGSRTSPTSRRGPGWSTSRS